jgi:hypothetical protein
MSYGTFKSVGEVAKKFDIKVIQGKVFTKAKSLDVPSLLFSIIKDDLNDATNYVSEYAVCDALIRPILGVVVRDYPLKIWSHVAYNVDEKQGLLGEPDYLIAPLTKYGEMARPALCIIEAKNDNFDKAWTQVLAEMVASSLLGATVCYGIVSTGRLWQFGKFEDKTFITDPNFISATDNLQYVFDTINWIFDEISA